MPIKIKLWKSLLLNKNYNTNPYYNIIHRLRRRFNIALKGRVKSGPTLRMLGMSKEEFKVYFESKFTEGMTWDAYLKGKIHIDHIIPCSFFDLSIPQNQAICFYYKNLQPLWGSDNASKQDDIEWTPENIALLAALKARPDISDFSTVPEKPSFEEEDAEEDAEEESEEDVEYGYADIFELGDEIDPQNENLCDFSEPTLEDNLDVFDKDTAFCSPLAFMG